MNHIFKNERNQFFFEMLKKKITNYELTNRKKSKLPISNYRIYYNRFLTIIISITQKCFYFNQTPVVPFI